MKKYIIVFILLSNSALGQCYYPDSLLLGDPEACLDTSAATSDSIFDNLKNALRSPDKVLALDVNSAEGFDIGLFKNLKWLGLNNQPIKSLPQSFYQYDRLLFLSLSGNDSLKISATDILNMKSLKEIFLDGTPINRIENSINENKHLTFLFISNCNLSTLPTSFSNLIKLRGLYAYSNNLQTIPECIYNLSNLEVLNLSECPIKTVEAGKFKKLARLKRLILVDTQIPEDIIQEIAKNLPPNCFFISKRPE